MSRFLIALTLIVFTFTACKKENSQPQWDIEVLGPLVYAQLGIDQIVGDSSIISNLNGALILNYDTLLSQLNIDSLYQVADTTIPTVVIFPPFPSTIQPNTPFFSNNNNIKLGVSGVELKQAIIFNGKIKLEIKNTLHSKINFVYTIPKAVKNGLPFTVTASVDSASTSNPKYYSNEYDFSGYEIDMTGANGNSFNTITYNVEARSDPNGVAFTVNASDTIVNLSSTLIGIEPYFVRGYLGQADSYKTKVENTGLGRIIKSGLIKLDSAKLNLDITNYIGADEQAYISYLQSYNSRTNTIVDLVAPSLIKNYLNINRATINPTFSDSLVPTHYSIELNKNNSNLIDFIANIPEQIAYDMKLALNPLGNVSGGNDFVFRDRLIDIYMKMVIPLNFAANQLVLADTLPFTISNATDYEAVGPATFTLLADNGFPFDLNMQLFLIDSTNNVIDSLLVPDLIRAAPYDLSYRATGTSRSEIKIPIDANRKQRLLSVKRIGVRLKLNTPDFPQLIQLYSDYKIDFKLIADGIYLLR